MSCDRRIKGFSLVELMVAIGVVGVLVAMLLPALHLARENAQRVKCQSNLRQIGLAFEQYANANGWWLPSWSGWHATAFPSDPSDEASWCGKLANELPPDSPVYRCPSFPQEPIAVHNYFICAVWSFTNGLHSTKLSDIRTSSQFVMAAEVTQPAVYPRPLGTFAIENDDYDRDDASYPCLCFPGDGGFLMHRGGNNVLFADMHVETFAAFVPVRITFHPRRMLSWAGVAASAPDDPQGQSN